MKLDEHIRQLKINGLTFIEKAFSVKECEEIKIKLDNIIDKFRKKKILGANKNSQIIYNPFRHDIELIKLIFHKKVDKILREVLDEDYVLIQCSTVNRKLSPYLPVRPTKDPGTTWHTDSRSLGKKKISAGFSYLVIAMFDDFTDDNSASLYVPKSHNLLKIPARHAKYKYKNLLGKQGTIVIMDTGIYHKSGKPSARDRWSMFSIYGGWFMKPYYRYWDMLKTKEIVKLDKTYKKLLHFNSIPPKHEEERFSTLTKL